MRGDVRCSAAPRYLCLPSQGVAWSGPDRCAVHPGSYPWVSKESSHQPRLQKINQFSKVKAVRRLMGRHVQTPLRQPTEVRPAPKSPKTKDTARTTPTTQPKTIEYEAAYSKWSAFQNGLDANGDHLGAVLSSQCEPLLGASMFLGWICSRFRGSSARVEQCSSSRTSKAVAVAVAVAVA